MALTNVVTRLVIFQRACEVGTKFVPVIVSVKAGPPALVLGGESDEITGTGLLTVKLEAALVPPPGAGLTTVTRAICPCAMSLARMAAFNCMALTTVVFRAEPFHITAEVDTNFLPLTVSVKAAPPAVTLEGESEVIAGTGLLIVNVCAAEVPPPGEGLNTTTDAVPAAEMSAALIAAVSFVLLTKVVVRFEPFHCTTDVFTKFVPVTVSVKAGPPATALEGANVVSAGEGLLMVNV